MVYICAKLICDCSWIFCNQSFHILETIVVGNVKKIVFSLGCSIKYNWCKTTPKIRPIQFAIGVFLGFVGYSMSRIVTILLYSKIIGPRKQVRRNFFVLFLKVILYFSEKNANRPGGRGLLIFQTKLKRFKRLRANECEIYSEMFFIFSKRRGHQTILLPSLVENPRVYL